MPKDIHKSPCQDRLVRLDEDFQIEVDLDDESDERVIADEFEWAQKELSVD